MVSESVRVEPRGVVAETGQRTSSRRKNRLNQLRNRFGHLVDVRFFPVPVAAKPLRCSRSREPAVLYRSIYETIAFRARRGAWLRCEFDGSD